MSGDSGGFNLGNAYGAVIIDVSGVGSAMQQAQKSIASGLSGVGQQIGNAVSSIGEGLESIGSKISGIGTKMASIGLPVAAGFAAATKQAMDFDESITNIAAVLGLTSDESAKLGDQLKGIGASSRAGAQGVAQAYYDIAGGVADASTHMAILQAAIKTSEAGNADLAGTTSALISVMNSYNLTAEQASMVSDVLTRTVGMGVGTMDEFASAFPQVTGIANSLGISFENVGQMMAYLTTKGNTASESATQLSGLMVALLKPNTDMADALKELGFESGEAAVKQLGLLGAYKAIQGTQTANAKGIAALTGRVESLRAVTAFGGKDVETFFKKFSSGVKNATDAARAIQNQSMAAKWDILNARIQDVAITLGTTLFPILTDLMTKITPIIYSITQWIEKNPELVQQIALLVGGLVVFGPILAGIGAAIGLVGTIISGIGAIIGIVLSPIGLLIGAGVLLVALFKDQIGAGISVFIGLLQQGKEPLESLAGGIIAVFGDNVITQGIAKFLMGVQNLFDNWKLYGSLIKLYAEYYFQGVVTAIHKAIDEIITFIDNNKTLVGAILVLGGIILIATGLAWAFSIAMAAIGTVVAVGSTLLTGIAGLIALLTGPVGLVALLIALVGAVIIAYPGGFPGLLNDAADAFVKLVAVTDLAFLKFVRDLGDAFRLLNGEMITLASLGMPGVTASFNPDLKNLPGGIKGPGKSTTNGTAVDFPWSGSVGATANLGGGTGSPAPFTDVFGRGVVPIPPVGGGSGAKRDGGGSGFAGMQYQIGPSQLRNEVYIPGADGQFVNDFVDLMKSVAAGVGGGSGQGGDTINVMMPAAALASPAAAQANGEIFGRAVAEEMRARGIKGIK